MRLGPSSGQCLFVGESSTCLEESGGRFPSQEVILGPVLNNFCPVPTGDGGKCSVSKSPE